MDAVRLGAAPRKAGRIRWVVTGIGVGWVVTPFFVLFAAMARGSEGSGWALPALVALGLAVATGLLIGWAALGWWGLAGVAVGWFTELALAYLVVPPLLGLRIWGVDVYAEYVPGVLVAGVAAVCGTAIGARFATGRTLPTAWVLAAGLCVLVAWFGIWLVMGRSIGVAA